MYSTEEIKCLVKENIDQIKISEFAGEGGWPNLKDIDVDVFKQIKDGNQTIIRLHILYTVDRAGCCFIPGTPQQNRMSKTVLIKENNIIKIKDDE